MLVMFLNLTVEGYGGIVPIAVIVVILVLLHKYRQNKWLKQRRRRRDYYRNDYLKSDAWQRKRYVVLKRDNWTCQYCGQRATQVHHTRYAKYNIGKEPIEWLESVCRSCHESLH